MVDFLASCTNRRGDIPGTEGYVPSLNPLGGESPQGGEVLGQSHGGDHFTELLGRLDTEESDVSLRRGVDRGDATEEPDGHREFNRADEVALRVLLPRREDR